jgi:hypothetical protein
MTNLTTKEEKVNYISNLPKIRIQFGNLLYNTLSKDVFDLKSKEHDLTFPEAEDVKSRVEEYKRAWEEKEPMLLKAMTQVLEIDFFQNAIDVYVAPFMPVLSDPLIINTRREPDSFVDGLSHELLHRLLDDSVQEIPYGKILNKLFPEENQMVRNHVIIFSVLKYLFLDILKEPYRLERKINFHQKSPHYKRAWEIVEADDYKALIEKFKSSYILIA